MWRKGQTETWHLISRSQIYSCKTEESDPIIETPEPGEIICKRCAETAIFNLLQDENFFSNEWGRMVTVNSEGLIDTETNTTILQRKNSSSRKFLNRDALYTLANEYILQSSNNEKLSQFCSIIYFDNNQA